MKVAVASDHAGFELKEKIKLTLDSLSVDYDDFGPSNMDSVDYPDYAERVAKAVQEGGRGILCCGTGIGMSIVANKFRGIRAALCHNVFTAQMSREHNDSNILILGGRTLPDGSDLHAILKVWLETEFTGGRHKRRLDKIKQLEEGNEFHE